MTIRPPSTISVCPVTKDASLDARNSTAPAISAGLPMRFSNDGGRAQSSPPEAGCASSCSVAIQPGLTPLTRMPWGAASAASARVSPSTPALATQ